MSPRTVEELIAVPKRVKYVFFWRHRPRADGRADAGCMSQWWPSAFTVDGVTFRTAEHYMMWRKARLFGDEESATRILAAKHPARAKELGRGVLGFRDEEWVRERFAIVVDAGMAKFGQHPDLREYLLGTGERVLVEASPLDRIWGIGLVATDERATDPSRWRGLNLLGFALMEARARLRER
ncbi:NADAR family protein [Actinoplanes sp. NPDC051851]|uniref:NADAR family protein n=1 Tax=Actinoplanes sp. NPDC051851 TaxID=3154753 RepID=UPI00341A315B